MTLSVRFGVSEWVADALGPELAETVDAEDMVRCGASLSAGHLTFCGQIRPERPQKLRSAAEVAAGGRLLSPAARSG